jgi:HEAT repeat protein
MLAVLADPAEPTARRLAAIQALSQRRSYAAILPLINAMREEPLANACSYALIQIRSRCHLRRLVRFLTPSTPDYLKQEAIYCLWMLNDRRGASTLAKIALDRVRESDHTRLMSTEALSNNNRKGYIQQVLAQAFNDPAIGVRMSALCAAPSPPHLLSILRRAMEARLNDPEIIYDEPFGEHVRKGLQTRDFVPPTQE